MGRRRAVDETQQERRLAISAVLCDGLCSSAGATSSCSPSVKRGVRRLNPPSPPRLPAPWSGSPRRTNRAEPRSCAEVYARDLVPLRVHGATTELTLAGGTAGSNHSPSSAESAANFVFGREAWKGPRRTLRSGPSGPSL